MPKTFYHLSLLNLGETATLLASLPSRTYGDEPKIPRVCFGTSIRKCLFSLYLDTEVNDFKSLIEEIAENKLLSKRLALNNFSIYTPLDSSSVIEAPGNIADFKLTNEHWSTSNIAVKRLGFIDTNKLIQGTLAMTTNAQHSLETSKNLRAIAKLNRLSGKKVILIR